MPKKKKVITLTGKAAELAFIEHSLECGGRKVYPQQPFLYGYCVISFESPVKYASRVPLAEDEKALVERFAGCGWRPTKGYLRLVKSLLIQRCNVQNPDGLVWDDILTHITVYLEEQQKVPGDLITLLVVVEKYHVSRATVKRKIKAGEIWSYRKSDAAENSPHLVSESQISKLYPAK
jgi:hypothetical protein